MENRFYKKNQKGVPKIIINIGVIVIIALLLIVGRNLLSNFISSTITVFNVYSSYFFAGIGITVILSLVSVIFGTLLGLLIYTLRTSKAKLPSSLAKGFVEIIRGTPLLVQMMIVFVGASSIVDIRAAGISTSLFAFISGAIAVTINSGAYVSEIIRSGIQSVDKGQMEAGRSLGLSKRQTMREIIYPQAIKNILPAIGNEFITIIKETSIVSYIGVADIMYNVNIVRGVSFRPMEPLVIAAIMYFILTFTLSKLLGIFERRLKESD